MEIPLFPVGHRDWCPECEAVWDAGGHLERLIIPERNAVAMSVGPIRSDFSSWIGDMELSSSDPSVAYVDLYCRHPDLDPGCSVAGTWVSGMSAGLSQVTVTAREASTSFMVEVIVGG